MLFPKASALAAALGLAAVAVRAQRMEDLPLKDATDVREDFNRERLHLFRFKSSLLDGLAKSDERVDPLTAPGARPFLLHLRISAPSSLWLSELRVRFDEGDWKELPKTSGTLRWSTLQFEKILRGRRNVRFHSRGFWRRGLNPIDLGAEALTSEMFVPLLLPETGREMFLSLEYDVRGWLQPVLLTRLREMGAPET